MSVFLEAAELEYSRLTSYADALSRLSHAVASATKRVPIDQVGLGGALALDRTTIGVVVKKLEERGLVERSVSEKDRRSKPVSITKKGAGLIRDVLPSAEAAQDRMLAPLTASERAQFMRLLGKMANGNNSESRAPLRR